jgi:hypothetical protein
MASSNATKAPTRKAEWIAQGKRRNWKYETC